MPHLDDREAVATLMTDNNVGLDTISGQIRAALKDHPGLTSRELSTFVEVDTPEQLNRTLYDLKSHHELTAEKDPSSNRLRYTLADDAHGQQYMEGNGVGRPSTGNGKPPRRVSHSPLERPIQVLMTAITQRIEDTPTLDLIWAWGDLMVESAKGLRNGGHW